MQPITQRNDTLNPYRIGLSLVYHRLRYDLQPFSRRNQRRVKALQNTQQGRKCVILCNGPSLNKVDFDALDRAGVYTIGLNKINLLFGRVAHRPNAIVCVNPHVIGQNARFFGETTIPVFLDYVTARQSGADFNRLKANPALHFLNSAYVHARFAKDVSVSVCQGFTVTYVALQLAYHLGFDQVALVGCDHTFAVKGTANQEIRLAGKDHSHFDPNYFSPQDTWQLPDLLGSEYHYQVARDEFLAAGRQLYNCTEGGKLELFERKSLADFLAL